MGELSFDYTALSRLGNNSIGLVVLMLLEYGIILDNY